LRGLINLSTRLSRVTNQSVGIVSGKRSADAKRVEINRTIEPSPSKIYPAKTVNDILREYGKNNVIGQFKCMCRRLTENVNDPCRIKMPDDVGCLGFGSSVRAYIKYGQARQVSLDEAFDIIQKARDHGAVHTVFHEKDDSKLPEVGICNCCWDCCGIMRTYNMGASPLKYSCYYTARIADHEKCNGCQRCSRYCPTAAITVVEKKALLDVKKCIGCGQCVHQCRQGALDLTENRRIATLPMLKKSEARIKA
jgi:ferredoxin